MGYYCPYCGTYLNDTDQVCPACGRSSGAQAQPTNSYQQSAQAQSTNLYQQSAQAQSTNPYQQNVQAGNSQQSAQAQTWEEDPYQQTIVLDDYIRQQASAQQLNTQQAGWSNQAQPNMQQAAWSNQAQPNMQQAAWNNQAQPNMQQQNRNGQPQVNSQQPYVQQPYVQQPNWNNQAQPNMQQQNRSGQPQVNMQQSNMPQANPQPKMKWFKFVIWVQLFLSAIVAVANAVLLLTGYTYGDMRDLVYVVYPSLKPVDLGCGIAYAVLAVLAIIVRFRLSGFHKNGPSLYIFYLVMEVLVSLAYIGLVFYVISSITIDISFIASMVSIGWSIVLIILNVVYFGKRKQMFSK